MRRHHGAKIAVYLGAIGFLVWLTLTLLIFGSKCNMGDNLNPIILNLLDTFEKNNIPCYLDDGTLLGFYRDGKVTDYEFDVDFSIPATSYEKLVSLRHYLKEKFDYTLYTGKDYIFQKAWTMLYTLKWDPYLPQAPCIRIYDPKKWYYSDVYCDHRVDKETMLNLTKFPPAGWDDPANAGKMYLCDLEPTPENCFLEDVILPLKTIPGLGRTLPVPNDIPRFLSQVYGPNGWQKPRPKGVKIVMCHPVGWWVLLILSIGTVAALAVPVREYFRDRMRPGHVLPVRANRS